MILAIDTATRWIGLAIHDGRNVLAEEGWRANNTQTVELAPAVASLFDRTGIQVHDLAAVAVAIGPGSYTGLRIGLGFAKGLSLANQVRLIGVPTLDIIAAGQPWYEGQLIAIAEAGRTRICVGRYTWVASKGWLSTGQPEILSWEELIETIEDPTVLAGEVSLPASKLVRSSDRKVKLVSPAAGVRRAGYLAEIGWNRLKRGWTDDPAGLGPIYLLTPG